MKIGILTTSPGANEPLVKTIEKMGHEPRIINPRLCYQFISENVNGHDRLYYGNEGDEPERITAKSLDAIIPRLGSGVDYGAALLRFINENLGVYCPVNSWGLIYAQNKSWTKQRLSNAGIPQTRTITTESPAHAKWLVDKLGSLPIIIKTNLGSKGKTVSIIDTKRSANSMLEFCLNSNMKILIEEFIEADSSDFRVWVVGESVAVAMKRTSANKDDFRANLSRGGTGELAELSDDDKNLCIKSAKLLGLGIAGVDLIKSKVTGKSYIIEVNANPGNLVIECTGVNPWENVIRYIEANYKKAIPGGLMAAMTESFLFNSGTLISEYTTLLAQNKALQATNERLICENVSMRKPAFRTP